MVPYVHILVASDDETQDAALGAEGVLEGAAPGSIAFLHGTISPGTTKQIAQAAAKYQVDVLGRVLINPDR